MKIKWLGHSAFRIETGSSVILIDPFLSGSPVFEGSVEEAAVGCTHVALTHGHDDHVGDTIDICKQTGATLIAVYEICVYLNARGVENIDPTNTGGTIRTDDFAVSFVRADHSSSASAENGMFNYLGNPCGLIITPSDGPVVYHMGDTSIFGDMALINEMYSPDIGIVPVGDRFTMDGPTAALACKRYFDFKTVIPSHYGTFPIIEPDASKFLAEMDGENVTVLEVGGALDV